MRDIERIQAAALKIEQEIKRGNKVVVVVSAMAGVTDTLISYCKSACLQYDEQEYDAVIATGEQVTSGLMALALKNIGIKARSWHGWQIKLVTDTAHSKARILRIETDELLKSIQGGTVAVIAGFQGITEKGRVTTLGRGGSDTSAVAIAIALKADRCDIYTDVDGVYTADPRIVKNSSKMHQISYEEMLELASLGAKVLQVRSVEMAMKYNMPVQVLSTFENAIGSDLMGTLVVKETNMESKVVTGITYTRDAAKITLIGVPDKIGIAAAIFTPLAAANINVDMIIQTAATPQGRTDLTFTVGKQDLERAVKVIEENADKIQYTEITCLKDVSKVSLIGIGMRSNQGVAASMFRTLAEKGINIIVIETSEITISVLIKDEYTELAVRALHAAYGLEN